MGKNGVVPIASLLSMVAVSLMVFHSALNQDAVVLPLFTLCFAFYCFSKVLCDKVTGFSEAYMSTALLATLGILALCYLIEAATVIGTFHSFIVGDSDSLQYHTISEQISNQYSLIDQILQHDIVSKIGHSYGIIIPNIGYYRFLGIVYTLSGTMQGPINMVYLNVWSAIGITFFAIKISSLYTKNIRPTTVLLFVVLLFSNSNINNHALHIRKDFLLVFFLVSSIYFGFKEKWIQYLLLAGLAFSLRKLFLPLLLLPVLFSVRLNKLTAYFTSLFNFNKFVFFSVLLIVIMPDTFFYAIGIGITDFWEIVPDGLYISIRSAAVFVNTSFLRPIYALLYPFPAFNFSNYLSLAGWWMVIEFLTVLYLLKNVYDKFKRLQVNEWKLAVIWLMLYFMILLNVISASLTKMYGCMEPRYKFAFYVISGVIFVVQLSNKKNKNEILLISDYKHI